MRWPGRSLRAGYRAPVLVFLLLAAIAGCDGGPAEPENTLLGSWTLVGFTDAGVAAVATGTADFLANGTFSVTGTVTFPGEPTDPIAVTGTYRQTGSTVQLTVDQQSSDWRIDADGDQVVLTEVAPPPANSITLKRRP